MFINARSGFSVDVFPSKIGKVFAFNGYVVGKTPFNRSSDFVMYVCVGGAQEVNRDIQFASSYPRVGLFGSPHGFEDESQHMRRSIVGVVLGVIKHVEDLGG